MKLCPWVSDDINAVVSSKVALGIVDFESTINDIVCKMAVTVGACMTNGMTFLEKASHVASLRKSIFSKAAGLQALKALVA